ncbi:hypothetical protein JX266_000287 [Neoarthrinium moseri]|nr:hypothetical protein JX266_000287 [Neoarthrinium moseri]
MTAIQDSGISMTLKGVQETTLFPLAAKAQDAAQSKPVLGDRYAAQTLSRIDANYDWRRAKGNAFFQAVLISRARLLDLWTANFLQSHDQATVIHLACGLDNRCLRLAPIWNAPEKTVRWLDIDLPDVVHLRKGLDLPRPEGDYDLRAADALDKDWLVAIPADRPTIVIAEGLLMYLQPEDGLSILQRAAQRFQGVGGQIICDLAGSWVVGNQKHSPTSRMATLHWTVNDAEMVAKAVRESGCQRFRLDHVTLTEEMTGGYSAQVSVFVKVLIWLVYWTPWRLFSYAKFAF